MRFPALSTRRNGGCSRPIPRLCLANQLLLILRAGPPDPGFIGFNCRSFPASLLAMLLANLTQRAVSGRNRSAKSLPIVSCENWNVRSRIWRHPCESVSYSPRRIWKTNINLVGGDPYAGSCAPSQFFLWRPLPGLPTHDTPIAGLYHIGASTHPGPGLHGASGIIIAKRLLSGRALGRLSRR